MPSRQSAQQRLVSHSIDLFQGGMDSDASPYRVGEGQAVLGENIEFYRDNTLRARRGFSVTNPNQVVDARGGFLTQRVGGSIKQFSSDGLNYVSTGGATSTVHPIVAVKPYTLLRNQDSVLSVEQSNIYVFDGAAQPYHVAGVDTPAPLTATTGSGGSLKEGTYTYVYNYLLVGGFESPQSKELNVTTVGDDKKITLTIPTSVNHPDLFRIRLFRQNPGDGLPLLVTELPIGTTTYVDTGIQQSAYAPIQGVRVMPGGNLALLQNRRLFTVSDSTLNYSYPGQYAYSNVFWTEKVNLPTGEAIRAICPLGQGVIFFGLETAIYMNTVPAEGGTFSPVAIPDGCVAQSAWTQAEDGTLLYVGKGGVYAMQGLNAQRISDPVNNYFNKYSVGELETTTIIFDQQERRLLVALPQEVLVYYFQTKAWSVWTLPGLQLDWFEGRIYYASTVTNKIGVLGEAGNDDGAAITGKFVSGVHGLDDPIAFKMFRRMGLQVSASSSDTADMTVRALDSNTTYSGLPTRVDAGPIWGVALWGAAQWGGNTDTTQTVSLPDNIQGRYIQFTITFSTTNASQFVITGPVVVEYRQRYRYGRV